MLQFYVVTEDGSRESRARTNSGSGSNDGAVRREAGLVLHEIGHHCIRRFPGPDMSAPRTDRGPDSCRAAVLEL